jgi:hypothetical protein
VNDVLDVLDRDQHPWVALCDAAECSPDFDVVYHFNEAQAVVWLKTRLERQGYEAHYGAIQTAYREWPPQ